MSAPAVLLLLVAVVCAAVAATAVVLLRPIGPGEIDPGEIDPGERTAQRGADWIRSGRSAVGAPPRIQPPELDSTRERRP